MRAVASSLAFVVFAVSVMLLVIGLSSRGDGGPVAAPHGTGQPVPPPVTPTFDFEEDDPAGPPRQPSPTASRVAPPPGDAQLVSNVPSGRQASSTRSSPAPSRSTGETAARTTAPATQPGEVQESAGWPELTAVPPSRVKSLRSVDDADSTFVEFVNGSDVRLHVYWIDYEREWVFYATLEPGASYVQQTFVTHPWVCATDSGEVREAFLPSASPARAVLG